MLMHEFWSMIWIRCDDEYLDKIDIIYFLRKRQLKLSFDGQIEKNYTLAIQGILVYDLNKRWWWVLIKLQVEDMEKETVSFFETIHREKTTVATTEAKDQK